MNYALIGCGRISPNHIAAAKANGHTPLYADVIDAIKNDRKPYVDAVAGRNALEMILSIYKSVKTGQPVKLPLENFASTDMIGEFDND